MLLLIGYAIKINLRLGMFLLMSFIVTNDVINKYQTSRKILRIINSENKLREIKLNQLLEPKIKSIFGSKPNIESMVNHEIAKEIVENINLEQINKSKGQHSEHHMQTTEQYDQINEIDQIDGINYNKSKFANINF
jgi:hypothetical protein